MPKAKNRSAHAEALRARQRADDQTQFRFAAETLLVGALAGALALGALTTSAVHAKQVGDYALADCGTFVLRGVPADPLMSITWQGQTVRTGVKELAAFQPLQDQAITFAEHLGMGGLLGLGLSGTGLWLTADRRRRKEEELLVDRVIRGTKVVDEAELARRTATESTRALRFGSVPIPFDMETRHIAVPGATGTGKTTAMRQFLDVIEVRGSAALVYDTSGEFIEHYYNPARGDVILNPFDQRSAFWNPFVEIRHPADAARIAHHLVNETGDQDKDVWLDMARKMTANVMRNLWQEGRCTLQALLDALQFMPREELERWLAHTSSSRTFEKDAERATASVLFMLAKAVDLLMFLRCAPREGEASFSFAQFFSQLDSRKGRKPWIFISRQEDYFEAMKPLMALWLECAASAVLGLTPRPSRRVFFLLDELADLPHVENLERLLPQGRKFGACVILSFQAIGQMRAHYGAERAEALLGSCSTKLFLQLVDRASRQWASETIGSIDVEISTMSESLDLQTGKPQRTLSTSLQNRPAVLESELRLPKHTGYLLLPDDYPVAKIKLTADHINARGPARQPGYIPADVTETLWGTLKPSTKTDDIPPATSAEPIKPVGPGPV